MGSMSHRFAETVLAPTPSRHTMLPSWTIIVVARVLHALATTDEADVRFERQAPFRAQPIYRPVRCQLWFQHLHGGSCEYH